MNTPLSLPVFSTLPTFQSAPFGTQDIEVAQNDSIALQAGSYRDIIVGEGAQLSLDSFFSGSGSTQIAARKAQGPRSAAHAFTSTATALPSAFGLQQNYPNPFNPETEILFQLPAASHVVLKIYDIVGHEIATLAEGHYLAGYPRVQWNGKDRLGGTVASGMYFYQLRAGQSTQVGRMNLLR